MGTLENSSIAMLQAIHDACMRTEVIERMKFGCFEDGGVMFRQYKLHKFK